MRGACIPEVVDIQEGVHMSLKGDGSRGVQPFSDVGNE